MIHTRSAFSCIAVVLLLDVMRGGPASTALQAAGQTGAQPSTVLVKVCVPRNLVDDESWNTPYPGSVMAAFKTLIREFVAAHGTAQVEYQIRSSAFTRFEDSPGGTWAPDPRTLLDEVSSSEACPATSYTNTLEVDAPAARAEKPQDNFVRYLEAAQAGNAMAQIYIALMYEHGDGVAQSDAQAVSWYRRAALQGRPYAMLQLGMHLRAGKGVAWGEAEAMAWFKKAADSGAVDAMTALGVGFMAGLGSDAGQGRLDYPQAVYWFSRAAQQGDGFAQINLGILYEQGWGVDQDPNRARQLYAQAAASSSAEVATLGRQYFAGVRQAPRTSQSDLSDFWKTAIVVGIAAGGLAILSRRSSSDSGSGTTVSIPNIDPHDGFGAAGLPCYVGTPGCTPF